MPTSTEKEGINKKKAILATTALVLAIGGGIAANNEYKNHSNTSEIPNSLKDVGQNRIKVEDTYVIADTQIQVPDSEESKLQITDTFITPSNPVQ